MSIDMDADRSILLLTGVSVGCASHADDICTCNIGLSEIKSQAESISVFAGKNSLSLNKTKTEVVHLSRANFEPESINLCGGELVSKKSAKCLGVWWSHDLSSRKSIEENIKKARRAFFALGAMNVYNGKCNPLTSLSVFNSCVLPILLYGCETWFLSDPLLNLLDKFKAEVGKRILKLSVTHNSIFPLIGLHWPSFRVVILYRKLRLLSKLLSNNSNDSSGRVFRTLAAHDLLKNGLVEQCRELELSFGTDILAQCLHSPAVALDIVCQSRPVLVDADRKRTLELASSHPSLRYICSSEVVDDWLNLWNVALDYGPKGTAVAQTLFYILTKPLFGERKCPYYY